MTRTICLFDMATSKTTLETLQEVIELLKVAPLEDGTYQNLILLGLCPDDKKQVIQAFLAIGNVSGFTMSLSALAKQNKHFETAIKNVAILMAMENNIDDGGLVAAILQPDLDEVNCHCPKCQAKREAKNNKIKNDPNVN